MTKREARKLALRVVLELVESGFQRQGIDAVDEGFPEADREKIAGHVHGIIGTLRGSLNQLS